MIDLLGKLLDFIGIKTFMLSLLISALSYFFIKPSVPLAIIFFCSTFLFVSLLMGLADVVKQYKKSKSEKKEKESLVYGHFENIEAILRRIQLYNSDEWQIFEEIFKGSKDLIFDNIFILDNNKHMLLMQQIKDFVVSNNLFDMDNNPLITVNLRGPFGKQIIEVRIESKTLELIGNIQNISPLTS